MFSRAFRDDEVQVRICTVRRKIRVGKRKRKVCGLPSTNVLWIRNCIRHC